MRLRMRQSHERKRGRAGAGWPQTKLPRYCLYPKEAQRLGDLTWRVAVK